MSQRPLHPPPHPVPDPAADPMRAALSLETILQDWPGALARVTAYLGAIVRPRTCGGSPRARSNARSAPPGSAVATRSTMAERLLLETKRSATGGRGRLAVRRLRFAGSRGQLRGDSSWKCGRSRPRAVLRGRCSARTAAAASRARHRRRTAALTRAEARSRERRGAATLGRARPRRRALRSCRARAERRRGAFPRSARRYGSVELRWRAGGAISGSGGFWTAVSALRAPAGGDRFAITNRSRAERPPIPRVRTAVYAVRTNRSSACSRAARRARVDRARGALAACDLLS